MAKGRRNLDEKYNDRGWQADQQCQIYSEHSDGTQIRSLDDTVGGAYMLAKQYLGPGKPPHLIRVFCPTGEFYPDGRPMVRFKVAFFMKDGEITERHTPSIPRALRGSANKCVCPPKGRRNAKRGHRSSRGTFATTQQWNAYQGVMLIAENDGLQYALNAPSDAVRSAIQTYKYNEGASLREDLRLIQPIATRDLTRAWNEARGQGNKRSKGKG